MALKLFIMNLSVLMSNVGLKYFKSLDGVRGIAALMVIVFHFFQDLRPDDSIAQFLKKIAVFGQTGVTLFFVLSGFLITRILISTKEESGYFKTFYLRRTLRIFPLYYFFLIIYYWIFPIIHKTDFTPLSEQIYYYTYLQNIAQTFNIQTEGPIHFWSLAVEEHFYLFWPIVIYCSSINTLKKIIFTIIIGAILLRFVMIDNGIEVYYFTFTRIDSLALGAYLAILELDKRLTRSSLNSYLFFALSLLIPVLILWFFFTGESNDWIQVFKYTLISVVYFLSIAIIICLHDNIISTKILTNKIIAYSGKISYGLYVYHPLAFYISFRFINLDTWYANFFIGLGTTFILSSLSYHFIEVKFLRMKKFFTYKRPLSPLSTNIKPIVHS